LEQEPLKAADRGYHIRQILTNLVINAISTGHAGTIEISAVRDESSIRVLVRDQGPGIPADIQERIFEPFFSTRLDQGGTGLGLSLSRRMAADLGGELRLLPSDTGALFELRVPGAAEDS
jgi:signal transduction histidine kinase